MNYHGPKYNKGRENLLQYMWTLIHHIKLRKLVHTRHICIRL